MHDADRMMQRWGLLAACALYAVSAVESARSGSAPDQLVHDLGITLGLAMLGLPVWLPRRFSEGANAGYAYGPRPVLLQWQRAGIVIACLLVVVSAVIGWNSSPRPVHRVLSVGMAIMAAVIAVQAWQSRRILTLPTRA
jgi:hypothetical protein